MKNKLIDVSIEIEDLIIILNVLGYDSNRGCVQALREAQGFWMMKLISWRKKSE